MSDNRNSPLTIRGGPGRAMKPLQQTTRMPRRPTLPAKLLLAYALFIVYATTIPLAFSLNLEHFVAQFNAFAADPFQLEATHGVVLTDMVSNILLFLPFGFFFLLARPEAALRAKRMRLVLQTTRASAALSGGVEFLQLLTHARVTSALDLVANVLGALLGAGLALRYREDFRLFMHLRVQKRLASSPELALFCTYALLLVLAQFFPFDFTLALSALKRAVREIDFSLPNTATELGRFYSKSLLFAAFSFLWLRTQNARDLTRTVTHALAATLAAAAALEAMQFFRVNHVVTLRNLLAGLQGGVYGAVLFILLLRRVANSFAPARPERYQNLTLKLARWHWPVFFLLLELQPYEFNFARLPQQLQNFNWLPFFEYYNRTGAQAFFDLCAGLVRFAVLALLLPARKAAASLYPAKTEIFFILIGASALSFATEILQLALPDRTASITDCVNAVIGAACGIRLRRHLAPLVTPRFHVFAWRGRKGAAAPAFEK